MIRDFFIVDLHTKKRFHKSFSKEPTSESIVKSFLLKYTKEFENTSNAVKAIKIIPIKEFMFTFLVKKGFIFMIISDIHDSKKDLELVLQKVVHSLSHFDLHEPIPKDHQEELGVIITRDLFSQIKIALIGKDNVGKSTIFNQLEGEISYPHSKRVMRSKHIFSETTEPSVYLLDYIGTEDYSPQWPNLLRGIHIIFIVVDSTVENVLSTKRLFINLIKRAKPDALLLGIANKQDQAKALDAKLIQKMLDIDAVFPLSMDNLTNTSALENIFLHAVQTYLAQFLDD
ncbi:MAG: 50S ribosome-binding GTPase [Candidatus Lokiarchaeota archaeon]|nr:50S ribosome-binding GTPase [Candidatus Lokiarchaeota archaeon]